MCACILTLLPQFLYWAPFPLFVLPFSYFYWGWEIIDMNRQMKCGSISLCLFFPSQLSLSLSTLFVSLSLSVLTKEYHHTGDYWTINTYSHMYKGTKWPVVSTHNSQMITYESLTETLISNWRRGISNTWPSLLPCCSACVPGASLNMWGM